MKTILAAAVSGAALLVATSALAAAAAAPGAAPAAAPAAPAPTPPPPIGPNITLEQAKQVVAAAEAEATKRGLKATIAIVDTAGTLVYYRRPPARPTRPGTSPTRRRSRPPATAGRRPSIEARLAAGNPTLQYAPDIFPFGGGVRRS